jgi:nucleoid DNA-binding protein
MAVFNKKNSGNDLLPGITDYLESTDDAYPPVTASGLDDLIAKVKVSTGISEEAAAIIIKLFFQEIRNKTAKGHIVVLKRLGKFFVSSPKVSNNKKKVYPTFKPFRKLIAKLNQNGK